MEPDPGIQLIQNDSCSSGTPNRPPPLPTSPLPDEEGEKENHRPVTQPLRTDASPAISIPAKERLIGGRIKLMTVEARYEEKQDADDIPPLPKAHDQKIKLNKDAEALGLQVETEEGGRNGMILRSLTKDGTLACDKNFSRGLLCNCQWRNIYCSQALVVLKM